MLGDTKGVRVGAGEEVKGGEVDGEYAKDEEESGEEEITWVPEAHNESVGIVVEEEAGVVVAREGVTRTVGERSGVRVATEGVTDTVPEEEEITLNEAMEGV